MDCDAALLKHLEKLSEVYGFVTQDEMLDQISSMHAFLGKISQQTRECAYFIRNYSETCNFWKRLGKNAFSETTDTIQKYSDVFDSLMQNFWDQVAHDIAIHVHCTEDIFCILYEFEERELKIELGLCGDTTFRVFPPSCFVLLP